MDGSARRLVDALRDDVESWLRGEDVDVESKHNEAIAAVGPVPLLSELFLTAGDSTLDGWLSCLAFAWKALPFLDWKEVLYRIGTNAPAVYQFVAFATRYLAIDVVRIIREDPAVDQIARQVANMRFQTGGPPANSDWIREHLEELGVDQPQMWRRLASEGAPMKADANLDPVPPGR